MMAISTIIGLLTTFIVLYILLEQTSTQSKCQRENNP